MNDPPRALVFHDVEVDGRRVDVVVRDGVVAEVAPRASTEPGAEVIDGRGGALLAGLHDHHLHLAAMAADRASVKVGPPAVTDASDMAAALRSAVERLRPGEWLRATGYHERVAGELDRYALDSMVGDRPVRVQHRTGAMWVFSSAAVNAADLDAADHPGIERDGDGRPTGRVFGADRWLRALMPAPPEVDLAAVGAELAGYGVTGVTDATPTDDLGDLELLAGAAARGELPQRVVVTGAVGLAAVTPPTPLDQGPVKIVVADHGLPPLDQLAAGIARAHAAGRTVAIHLVTHVATVLALTAWQEAGVEPGDRIEHGSVITEDTAAVISARGLIVVTQPSFVFERGDDYLRDVDPADQPYLYRCATLGQAGIGVGGSTDAPYGDADPWRAMRAAVERTTRAGQPLGPEEAVTPGRALDLFLGPPESPGGPPRRVRVGQAADLCLLAVPLAEALVALDADAVRMTFRRGRCVFEP